MSYQLKTKSGRTSVNTTMFTFIDYLVLTEAIQAPVLYRNTGDTGMMRMIEQDAIFPRTTHRLLGKSYQGTSMSRNMRLGSVSGGWYGDWWLTLDRTLLSHNNRILPVDADLVYYTTKHRKRVQVLTPEQLRRNRDRLVRKDDASQHAEEFVLGTIQPLHKYLLKIVSLHLTVDTGTPLVKRKVIRAVKAYAQKHNIPFYDAREGRYGEWKSGHFYTREQPNTYSNAQAQRAA